MLSLDSIQEQAKQFVMVLYFMVFVLPFSLFLPLGHLLKLLNLPVFEFMLSIISDLFVKVLD